LAVGRRTRQPEAWLLTVAKRRAIDARRRRRRRDAAGHLQLIADELAADAAGRHAIPDHWLALIFACAHPAIDPALAP
jgi:RNA polymerase sigma-70 factor (ECF subfamily)